MAWWKEQPEDAIKTIHRVIVAMGIEVTKIKPGTVHDVILKIMVIASTCASWLSELIRRNNVQQKTVRHILPVAHSIILCLAFLTEATVPFLCRCFNFVVFCKPHSWANTFCCIPPVIRNFRRCSVARSAMDYSLLQHLTTSWNSLSIFMRVRRFMFGFLTSLDSNQNFIFPID